MSKRSKPVLEKPITAPYFVGDKPGLTFISSGCTVLDCALGGGWAISRIGNIVGDRSTAKTALATEAIANFLKKFPDGNAAYRDCEAAFDQGYAEAMKIPVDKIDFGDEDKPLLTIEDFVRDFEPFLEKCTKDGSPGIYVLDSLDALSDESEIDSDIGKASYGMGKAKALSAFFRKGFARKIETSRVLLLVVSQVRENIGVTFGEKYRRAGGKALDFYCSQIVWLARTKTLTRSINKVERPYGVEIKAKVKKNKVGLPFREADFPFRFGYGVEDLVANIMWLQSVKHLEDINLKPDEVKDYLNGMESVTKEQYDTENETASNAVKKAWAEIETQFLPTRPKYG